MRHDRWGWFTPTHYYQRIFVFYRFVAYMRNTFTEQTHTHTHADCYGNFSCTCYITYNIMFVSIRIHRCDVGSVHNVIPIEKGYKNKPKLWAWIVPIQAYKLHAGFSKNPNGKKGIVCFSVCCVCVWIPYNGHGIAETRLKPKRIAPLRLIYIGLVSYLAICLFVCVFFSEISHKFTPSAQPTRENHNH